MDVEVLSSYGLESLRLELLFKPEPHFLLSSWRLDGLLLVSVWVLCRVRISQFLFCVALSVSSSFSYCSVSSMVLPSAIGCWSSDKSIQWGNGTKVLARGDAGPLSVTNYNWVRNFLVFKIQPLTQFGFTRIFLSYILDLATHTISNSASWRIPVGLQLLLGLILLSGIFFLPESPFVFPFASKYVNSEH